jgi:hypothetical protein
MMPSLSMAANSALAAASFSPSNRRNLEETGGPDVTMKCSTPWDAAGKTLDGFTTSEKLSRS